MSKTILVGCRLPNGLVVDGHSDVSITLNGTNTAYVPGAPGLTHVDEAQWSYISAMYAEHAAFKNNAVFATGSDKVADIADAADELQNERTGLEGLDPTKPGANLKPLDDAKLDLALQTAAAAPPRKSPTSKADKAAAAQLAAK